MQLHGDPEPLAQHVTLQLLYGMPALGAQPSLLCPAAHESVVAPATEGAVEQAQRAAPCLGAVECGQQPAREGSQLAACLDRFPDGVSWRKPCSWFQKQARVLA